MLSQKIDEKENKSDAKERYPFEWGIDQGGDADWSYCGDSRAS